MRYNTVRQFGGQGFIRLGSQNRPNFASTSSAQKVANHIRSRGYNSRVVPVKGGFNLYLRPGRSYNRTYVRPPWRRFQRPDVGIDQVALRDWLSGQPGYNPALDWRKNLELMGGPEAIRALDSLSNNIEMRDVGGMIAEEQGFALRSMIDDLFADTGLGQSTGFEARSASDLKQSEGGGLPFDYGEKLLAGEGTGEMVQAGFLDEFDIFGIDDGETTPDDDDLMEALNSLFEESFISPTGLLPEKVSETLDGVRRTAATLNEENTEKMGIQSADEIADAINNLFREEVFQGQSEIEWGGRQINRQDFFSDLELNPVLGTPQMEVPEGFPTGYWTFMPMTQGDIPNTDKRNAYLVVDSMGNVISGFPYVETNQSTMDDAIRNAFLTAQKKSRYEVYTSSNYEDYGRLAPGLAIVDGEVVVDQNGRWVGWEVARDRDDYRLDAKEYRLFVDGEQMEPGMIAPTILSRWILPQRFDGTKSKNYQQAEWLGVDFDAINDQNKVVAAEEVRRAGGDALAVLDAVNQHKYQVQTMDGTPFSTYLNTRQDAMNVMRSAGDNGDLRIVYATSDQGIVDPTTEKIYANAFWDNGRGTYLLEVV